MTNTKAPEIIRKFPTQNYTITKKFFLRHLLFKPIPGTTLKCLEDPSFEFESSAPAETETCINQPPPAKKPAYRVLEGKFINRVSFLIYHVM